MTKLSDIETPIPSAAAKQLPDRLPTERTAPIATSKPTPAPKTREGTKQSTLIAMLSTKTGATIGEITAATGWQAHTVRGAVAGALK